MVLKGGCDVLKIFLVEDEFIVREGIKNNIDWEGEGFNFCGEAADGELAYPLIQAEQPDIIITDIRMPFMNGLELSRLVKKELPESKIIILSGHEEFSYAKEAIKIGVTEYLLKPINGTELLKVMKRVGQQILFERMEKQNYERYRREMVENEIDIKRKLFNDMIGGSHSTAVILERGKEIGLELGAQCYQIILFKYNTVGDEEVYSSELLTLEDELKDLNARYDNIILFDRAIEGVALLIKGDSFEQIDEVREKYVKEVKELFTYYPSVNYFGGMGTPVSRLTHLSESFESAARAFAHRFILEKNAIISGDELSELVFEDKDSTINIDELGNLDLKKAEAFLKSGEADEITFFVEEFIKSVGRASEKSFLFKQYVIMNIYFTVLTFLKEIGGTDVLEKEPFIGLDKMKEMISDSQKARDYMIKIFSIAIKRRDALRTKRGHRIIEQAKEYINKHYANENISLNDIAAYVNLSPSHFSTVFSRETGSSFIKYLTDLRINKAKELLKCSDLRCSDISAAVGYKDPHYFSYLFKKTQNCTPMQYRASKR